MKKTRTYEVSLSKSYIVTIESKNKEKALRYAEFYIGDCHDISTNEDKQKDCFLIRSIEPVINDSIGVEEVR